MSKKKRWILNAVDFMNGIGKRQIWTFTAASTFYLFLSLIPIVVLMCTLLPYTPLTQEVVLQILENVVPDSMYAVVVDIVDYVYVGSTAILSISAVATLWSASLSVVAIMRGMDAAYDLERRENYVLLRLRACFFMIIMLAAILVTLCAIVYGQMILDLIRSALHESWAVNALLFQLKYSRYPVMMLILFVVFLLLYRWMPTGRRKLFNQWPGALFTTVAWLLFSAVFSLYNSFSNKYSIYGLLGTVIIAMLWLYYCLFFLLCGAYINKYVDDKRNEKLERIAMQLVEQKLAETENEVESGEFISADINPEETHKAEEKDISEERENSGQ
ncbi:MAG: YihY/virulence factor BrkB family protein [Oscillospiraceae bacterium]